MNANTPSSNKNTSPLGNVQPPRIFYPNQANHLASPPMSNFFMPPTFAPNIYMNTLLSNYGSLLNGVGSPQPFLLQQGVPQPLNNNFMGVHAPPNSNHHQQGSNSSNRNYNKNFAPSNRSEGFNPHHQKRGGFHGDNNNRRGLMNGGYKGGNPMHGNSNSTPDNASSNNHNHIDHQHHQYNAHAHNTYGNGHNNMNKGHNNNNHHHPHHHQNSHHHQNKHYQHQPKKQGFQRNKPAPAMDRYPASSNFHARDDEVEEDEFFVPVVKRARDPVLDTPEEIQKWIESRKRNYPTKENIERKRKEKQLREELGESTKEELSILEQKLKKKIQLMNAQFDNKAKFKERQIKDLRKFVEDINKNGVKKVENAPSTPAKAKAPMKENSLSNSAKKPAPAPNPMLDILETFKEEIAELEHLDEAGEELEEGEIADDGEKNAEATPQGPGPSSANKEDPKAKSGERIQILREKKKQKKREKAKKKQSEKKAENEKKGENEQRKPVAEGETVDAIIESLRKKQKLDNEEYKDFFNYKANIAYHKYRVNTLLTSLTIDEIYKERSVILQILRYFVNENFFQKQEEESQSQQTQEENTKVEMKDEEAT